MKEWTLSHVGRLVGLVAAVAPVSVAVLDSLPWQWAVPLSAASLVAGETAERLQRTRSLSRLGLDCPEK